PCPPAAERVGRGITRELVVEERFGRRQVAGERQRTSQVAGRAVDPVRRFAPPREIERRRQAVPRRGGRQQIELNGAQRTRSRGLPLPVFDLLGDRQAGRAVLHRPPPATGRA